MYYWRQQRQCGGDCAAAVRVVQHAFREVLAVALEEMGRLVVNLEAPAAPCRCWEMGSTCMLEVSRIIHVYPLRPLYWATHHWVYLVALHSRPCRHSSNTQAASQNWPAVVPVLLLQLIHRHQIAVLLTLARAQAACHRQCCYRV